MPHYITETCIGCGICEIKCPTSTITGLKKELYVIHPERCIDCSVCGVYCPVSAIENNDGGLIAYVKPKEIPKAIVDEDLCTGCEFCIDICPFDCIALTTTTRGTATHYPVAIVDEKKCVACRLCESVCDKDSIAVPNPPTRLKAYLQSESGPGVKP